MRSYLLILFLLLFKYGVAQKYTLKQAIDTILKRNESIKSAEFEIEYSKLYKRSVYDFGKTVVSYTYGQFNSFYPDNGFAINQSFYFPTYYKNLSRFAGSTIKLANKNLQHVQLELILRVKKSYNSLQYLKSQNKLLHLQDSIFSKLVTTLLQPHLKETTTPLEKASAQSRLLEIKNRLEENENEIIEERFVLQALLKEGPEIDIAEDNLIPRHLSEQVQEIGLAYNPELLKVREEIKARDKWIAVEKGKMMPDINLAYFSNTIYGTQNINGSDVFFGTNRRFQGVTVNLSIPIFATPYIMRIKEAKLGKQIAESKFDYAQTHLRAALQVQLLQYEKYNNTVNYYKEKALPLSDEILAQTKTCYQNEIDNYLECVEAFNQAMDIKLNYLQKVKALNEAVFELENLTGTGLN